MKLNNSELETMCYALEKYVSIYEEYDVTQEKQLLEKLISQRWQEIPKNYQYNLSESINSKMELKSMVNLSVENQSAFEFLKRCRHNNRLFRFFIREFMKANEIKKLEAVEDENGKIDVQFRKKFNDAQYVNIVNLKN